MKRFFAFFTILFAVCLMTSDVVAQSRKEKKQSKKATNKGRGTKLIREECEEMAMDITCPNPRAAGNGKSSNESFATNMALLDARSNLAQQLTVMLNGMSKNFTQETSNGENTSIEMSQGVLQKAYFEKILTNTRPICKNAYLLDDGRFNVYICIEMDPNLTKSLYEQLRKDEIIKVELSEEKFKEEMAEARKMYLENLEQE